MCFILKFLSQERELHLIRFGKADMISGQRRYNAIVWVESIKRIARGVCFSASSSSVTRDVWMAHEFKIRKRCAKADKVSCSFDARVRSASRKLHRDDGNCVLRCTTGILQ